MHPLTKLVWKKAFASGWDIENVDNMVTDYLQRRAEWLKKEYGIKEATPPQHDIISDAFELSVGEKCLPSPKCETCHNKYNLDEGISPQSPCYHCKPYGSAHGYKPIEPKPCEHAWGKMPSDLFCEKCGEIKHREPKPKLPEKLSVSDKPKAFHIKTAISPLEKALINSINELIEYLRGRE